VKKIEVRVLTDEEVAERNRRCRARPSPRSTARCEDKPRHWERATPAADWHSGRTRGGYWKFWPVTEEETAGDA
jgi:hypothetical protein